MSPNNSQNDALENLARAQANAEAAEEMFRNSNADNHWDAWYASEVAERALEAAAEELVNERLLSDL
jgi:hypothetical protein